MNKQELIKEFEEIGIHGLNMFGTVVKGIPTETAIDLIKQLDEPQPVKVPPSVAVWIEDVKENGLKYLTPNETAHLITYYILNKGVAEKKVSEWVEDNLDDFALAWILGYEIEKEKRYLLKIRATKHYFAKDGNGKIYFSLAYKSCFTKKELEDEDFGWVFDCPGVEVTEVE